MDPIIICDICVYMFIYISVWGILTHKNKILPYPEKPPPFFCIYNSKKKAPPAVVKLGGYKSTLY